MDDSNLTESSRDQYRAYWSKAYIDYYRRLLGHARRLVKGKTYEAEDLVQEACCRVLTYPKNPAEVINPFGYLKCVMHRVWIAKWKSEKTALMESLEAILSDPTRQKEHPTVEPEILRIAENEGLMEELRIKQGPLTKDEKFLLGSLLEGQTIEDIAATLGEDPCRTKTRWYALLAKLRHRIKNYNDGTKGSGRK